jgi:hypothetical protein
VCAHNHLVAGNEESTRGIAIPIDGPQVLCEAGIFKFRLIIFLVVVVIVVILLFLLPIPFFSLIIVYFVVVLVFRFDVFVYLSIINAGTNSGTSSSFA